MLSRCQASNEEVLAGSPLSEQHFAQRTRKKLLDKGDQKSNEEVLAVLLPLSFSLNKEPDFFKKNL